MRFSGKFINQFIQFQETYKQQMQLLKRSCICFSHIYVARKSIAYWALSYTTSLTAALLMESRIDWHCLLTV